MSFPRKEPVPGEWQEERNPWGGIQRYRMIGGVKEYEAMVSCDGIMIPESQLSDYHARKKAAEAARQKPVEAPPRKIRCPFNKGLSQDCRETCALYTANGCALARHVDRHLATPTEGKACPFSPYPCTDTCALYNNGCIFAAI